MKTAATRQLTAQWGGASSGGGSDLQRFVPLPAHALPDLTRGKPYTPELGVTLEVWLSSQNNAHAGETLVRTSPATTLVVNVSETAHNESAALLVTLWLAAGDSSDHISIDGACASQLTKDGPHQLGIIIDGGPRLVMFIVDGRLCDGGAHQTRGWAWLYSALGDLSNGVVKLEVAPDYGGRVLGGRIYSRALLVSELVGNHRAGPGPLVDAD